MKDTHTSYNREKLHTLRPLIVLTGPTAVGKTAVSVEFAKAVQGEIISADSMQVYRGMDIGSAKIGAEEMAGDSEKSGAANQADWVQEARRYYIGIVGKYGPQVQAVLKKAAALDIRVIAPLHGPVLKENLGYYIGFYDKWSSYTPEEEGVTVAYASAYGHTKEAALYLAERLRERGTAVAMYDLARDDMTEAVADAFRYSKLVLACNTYNAGINPFMRDFVERLMERSYQKRKVGLIENGSWAPMAAKVLRGLLEKGKDLTFAENVVTLMSAMKPESQERLNALAEELAE